MTDQNGTMVYRGEFDPYGNLIYEWGLSGLNTRKFTGYERDSNTGLDYANARMYGAGRGRFIQPDIKGLGSADFRRPQTLNRYAYVSNDPVNKVDPTGLDEEYWFHISDTWAYKDNPGPHRNYFDGNFLPEEEGVDGGLGGDDGVSGNSGKRVLFGQQLVDFNEARNKAIKLLGDPESDCAKFLKSHGLNPVELATSLSALIPYDALQSTNIDSFGVFVGRVKDIFKQIAISSGSMPDVAVNNSGTSAYFNGTGLNTTIEIHETYHLIRPGISDASFYQQLGGNSADYSNYGPRAINSLLEKEGCK